MLFFNYDMKRPVSMPEAFKVKTGLV